MNMFRTVFTVMRKELRDLSRDRRTLALTLLMGPLLYPILILGMGKLAESRVKSQIEQPLEIPTIGAENAPNLVRFLAAQGGVVLPLAPLVDGQRGAHLLLVELSALGEEIHRVVEQHLFHLSLAESGGEHGLAGLWHLERIADAPVGGAVDDHLLCTILLQQRHHTLLGHFGIGVNGVTTPAVGVEHQR